MSDQEKRTLERAAKAGDPDAMRKANVDQVRYGEGVVGHMRTLIGQWIYVEGVKLNYRGILVDLVTNGAGMLEGLLMEPCSRVGEWGDQPEEQYEETMQGLRLIPYGTVCDVGLQQAHWPKTTPKIGPRRGT